MANEYLQDLEKIAESFNEGKEDYAKLEIISSAIKTAGQQIGKKDANLGLRIYSIGENINKVKDSVNPEETLRQQFTELENALRIINLK